MKKIKAFTIIELVISMMISSIIIIIIYYSFLFLNKQYGAYSDKSTATNEYRLFSKTFHDDVERSALIRDSVTGILVINSGMRNSDICYTYDQDMIVRTSALSSDTFRIKNSGFNKIYSTDVPNLITQIEIGLSSWKTNDLFRKIYSAEQLYKATQFLNE